MPDRLGHDDRRILGNIAENLHAVFLAVDEAVTFPGIELMSTANRASFLPDGFDQESLHGPLRLLAFLVGRGSKIAVGNQDDFLGAHGVLGG